MQSADGVPRSSVATLRLCTEGRDDLRFEVTHGDLVGRLRTAAVLVDDLRVSEAHALVALRSGELQLLALRRRFRVGGRTVSEIGLRPGVEVALAPGVRLVVEDVTPSEQVPALIWDGGQAPLLHDVVGVSGPPIRVRWRLDADDALQLWRLGDRWRRLDSEGRPVPVELGDRLDVGGVEVRVAMVTPRGSTPTKGPEQPLRLVTYYDTVHVLRDGREPVVLAENAARLVTELALAGAPVEWRALARSVWPRADGERLRGRLDAVLRRLRRKLGAAGVREDLIVSDGRGLLVLRLEYTDVVEDRT